jgi:hypothetical protein
MGQISEHVLIEGAVGVISHNAICDPQQFEHFDGVATTSQSGRDPLSGR